MPRLTAPLPISHRGKSALVATGMLPHRLHIRWAGETTAHPIESVGIIKTLDPGAQFRADIESVLADINARNRDQASLQESPSGSSGPAADGGCETAQQAGAGAGRRALRSQARSKPLRAKKPRKPRPSGASKRGPGR